MLKVTPISIEQVLAHSRSDDPYLKLTPGLYSWSERNWSAVADDYLADTFTHIFSYADNDQFLWTIKDSTESGFEILLSIRVVDYREAYDVGPEAFLEFVEKRTPEAMEWLVFNLDLLK